MTVPTLPQNDSQALQKARAAQIAHAQTDYVWNFNFENVVGVPMSKTVPEQDKPTIEWFIKVFEVVIEIVENTLANDRSHQQSDLDNLGKLQSQLKGIVRAHGEVSETGILGFIEEKLASIRALFVSDVNAALKELESILRILQVSYSHMLNQPGTGLGAYQQLFKTIRLNPVAANFQADSIFSYLRVAGPNPMLIRCINSIPDNLDVSDTGYQSVMGTSDSLPKALSEKRLFLVDYHELQPLVDNPGTYNGMAKQLFAPMALFARVAGAKELKPVAIQRTQKSAEYPVVYATQDSSSSQFWPWQMAKTIVQVADGNYHELFVHLARTHLVIEAIAVATHRHLAEIHPLNVLLLPHCEGTLFINNSAASSLIAKKGPIDEIFAAKITQSQASAGADRLGYDFYQNMLPVDLASRGVESGDVLPDYPYRDDALKVWEAIRQWVRDYVDCYYRDDQAVVSDYELSAWAQCLVTEGKIKGFKPILGKEQLVQVLTMIIFTASAQHAAVNFPQSSIMSYAPAVTGALWGPQDNSGATQAQWLSSLPPINLAAKQLDLLHLLGGVYYRMLGNYQSNRFPYRPWLTDPRITGNGKPLQRFQLNLKLVETQIKASNAGRAIPYAYLLPSKIPMSINI